MAESDKKPRLGDNAGFMRVLGSAPWLNLPDKKRYRAKVFKSGNSLAVRIPAGTKLIAGMEMNLIVEDGAFLSLEPVEHPKRKFNVAKVWGSATGLELIKPEDRIFAERKLLWDDVEPDEPRTNPK